MKQETERLELVPMSPGDIDIFHETNIDSFVREHLWDNEIISRDLSLHILVEVEQRFSEEGWGLWKILAKEDNAYIGYAGLWKFFNEQQPQLLYAIFEQYTGNGYASEAAKQVVSYCFETLDYRHLVASMNIENVNSINLCKRIGLSFRENQEIDGQLTSFYQVEKYQ